MTRKYRHTLAPRKVAGERIYRIPRPYLEEARALWTRAAYDAAQTDPTCPAALSPRDAQGRVFVHVWIDGRTGAMVDSYYGGDRDTFVNRSDEPVRVEIVE
jgi:hypothetical protein